MDKEYLQDASGNPTGKVNMKETDVSATDAMGINLPMFQKVSST